MLLKIDSYEKFHALWEALDQYTSNNEDAAGSNDPEEVAAEYPLQPAAEKMRDELGRAWASLAE